jgi:hypothetical protein
MSSPLYLRICLTPRSHPSFAMNGGNPDIHMSSNDPNNVRERSETSPSVTSSVDSMTGGAHYNMVGAYKNWILANAKIIYGPNQPYEVAYGFDSNQHPKQDVRTAYLITRQG